MQRVFEDLAREIAERMFEDIDVDLLRDKLEQSTRGVMRGSMTRAQGLHNTTGIMPGHNADPGLLIMFDQAIDIAIYRLRKEGEAA